MVEDSLRRGKDMQKSKGSEKETKGIVQETNQNSKCYNKGMS